MFCLVRWYFSLAPTWQDLTQGILYSGCLGSCRSVTSRGSSPVGLMLIIGSLSAMWARWAYCWTWTHSIYYVNSAYKLFPCLNSIWYSIAILCDQYCSPSRSWGPFGLESDVDLSLGPLPGTKNARQWKRNGQFSLVWHTRWMLLMVSIFHNW